MGQQAGNGPRRVKGNLGGLPAWMLVSAHPRVARMRSRLLAGRNVGTVTMSGPRLATRSRERRERRATRSSSSSGDDGSGLADSDGDPEPLAARVAR